MSPATAVRLTGALGRRSSSRTRTVNVVDPVSVAATAFAGMMADAGADTVNVTVSSSGGSVSITSSRVDKVAVAVNERLENWNWVGTVPVSAPSGSL